MLTQKQINQWVGNHENAAYGFQGGAGAATARETPQPIMADEHTIDAAIQTACRRLALAERLKRSADRMMEAAAAARANNEVAQGFPRAYAHSSDEVAYAPVPTDTKVSGVRVVIYSDEPILAAGLQKIAGDAEMQVMACCSSLAELKTHMANERPDIAVVDLTPQVTSAMLFELQTLAIQCKLVLWVSSVETDFALRALTMGIRGILRKTLSVDAHRECLRKVNSGALWFEGRVAAAVQ